LNAGVVYRADTTGHETVLRSFGWYTDGAYPEAGMIWDSAGNLYGTTVYGHAGLRRRRAAQACDPVVAMIACSVAPLCRSGAVPEPTSCCHRALPECGARPRHDRTVKVKDAPDWKRRRKGEVFHTLARTLTTKL
jgi:hypothetical protein